MALEMSLKAKLAIAVGALKTGVGFEPLDHTLGPRPFSTALAKIEGKV